MRASPTPQSPSTEQLIEKLAAIEHDRWSDWQKWVHEQLIPTLKGDPNFQIPKDTIRRWHDQIITPYADLTEKEKQSDRDQVMRYWPLLDSYIQEQRQQAAIRGEIRGKRLALEKMRMGAGEYHDDPYEYVVPLRHIKEYEAELAVFDLDDPNPIFRDNQAQLSSSKEKTNG